MSDFWNNILSGVVVGLAIGVLLGFLLAQTWIGGDHMVLDDGTRVVTVCEHAKNKDCHWYILGDPVEIATSAKVET